MRRSDERDAAILDIGEKRILLCFVEAVDLVHKENRPSSVVVGSFSFAHDGLDFLDPRQYRTERDKVRAGHLSNDARQRCLAQSRVVPRG